MQGAQKTHVNVLKDNFITCQLENGSLSLESHHLSKSPNIYSRGGDRKCQPSQLLQLD